MQFKFTFLCLLLSSFLYGQDVIDFESFNFPQDSFLNGSDGNGGFDVDGVFLPNEYNPDFNSFKGWAISNKTDTLTPGFMNQFSVITGSGFDESSNFALIFSANQIKLDSARRGKTVEGFYITNNTYAYLSMQDGDSFAKKFGGVTGDDPDYFLLTVKAYYNGELSQDSVDFYLADYRFEDNSQDYIVDEWTWLDLSSLGPVDSLAFSFNSTDVGMFGMNTPAYFCMDNLTLESVVTSTKSVNALPLEVYPNPSSHFIQINNDWTEEVSLVIFDMQGRLKMQQMITAFNNQIDIQALVPGTYIVMVKDGQQTYLQKILKQ